MHHFDKMIADGLLSFPWPSDQTIHSVTALIITAAAAAAALACGIGGERRFYRWRQHQKTAPSMQ